MKWKGRQKSTNVEDVRGRPASRSRGPGGRRLRLGGKTGGIGLIVVVAVVLLGGGDLSQVLSVLVGSGESGPVSQAPPVRNTQQDAAAADFVSVVLYDTETTWNNVFQSGNSRYQVPRLVLFANAVESACGYASSATGPFYCPPDRKIYLDTSFFDELKRLGAPGDFAQAYVIAHEVGHHVQNLTNVLSGVRRLQQRADKRQANALQVLVELQADCYAGVWANRAETQRDLLESGDVEEGLRAAASIGDDRLQRNAGRRVQPESFTHGSSEQRVKWFQQGMRTGDAASCDTFGPAGVRL